mmetsp:Transcript_8804/g.20012  ORF Transcript_8804/g.20012 Transcript_8804/m.20012 type:complete len:86 (+) Transcript_8804:597-854(+)
MARPSGRWSLAGTGASVRPARTERLPGNVRYVAATRRAFARYTSKEMEYRFYVQSEGMESLISNIVNLSSCSLHAFLSLLKFFTS